MLVAVLFSALVGTVTGWRFCREHYVLDFSSQGCGLGTVEVVDKETIHNVTVGLDTIEAFGRRIHVNRLLKRLERRAASIKPAPECWRDHQYTRSEHEVFLASKLLVEIKHPKALNLFVRLLDDPLFVERAPDWLAALGDVRACPALMTSWEKRPQYPFVYVYTFRALPYEPAVSNIIEVFRAYTGEIDAEALFTTLETISGESLQKFRGRNLRDLDSVQRLKRDLHNWWQQSQANPAG